MVNIVIDASFLLAYLLPDEKYPEADKAILSHIAEEVHCIAPSLLKFEVANALYAAVLRKRISPPLAQKLIKHMLDLCIEEYPIQFLDALKVSFKHHLSVYDASYLVLARKYHIALLTMDKGWKKVPKENL